MQQQQDLLWKFLVPNGLWAKYQIFRFWTYNKQWEELPGITYGFLKLPCGQSDKPDDRAGRWIDRPKVRSAIIYTSVVRERGEQAHINRKRRVEGMTCKIDFAKHNLISSSGTTSVKLMKRRQLGEARMLTWRTPVHTQKTEKKSFSFRWFFTTQAPFIYFYYFNNHEHLTNFWKLSLPSLKLILTIPITHLPS